MDAPEVPRGDGNKSLWPEAVLDEGPRQLKALRHNVTICVSERDARGLATEWQAECLCGDNWTGADYGDVVLPWREHVKERAS